MRKRIEFDKFKTVEEPQNPAGVVSQAFGITCNSFELKDVINLVDKGRLITWVSNGDWSMHNMLMSLLDVTGPADVWISSYALSETPARYLLQLREKKLISKLTMLIDNRVDTRTANTLQIVRSVADSWALVDTHAKVTAIKNADWQIAVIGSANYTENIRYEAGVIQCTPEAVEMQITWITKALANGIK